MRHEALRFKRRLLANDIEQVEMKALQQLVDSGQSFFCGISFRLIQRYYPIIPCLESTEIKNAASTDSNSNSRSHTPDNNSFNNKHSSQYSKDATNSQSSSVKPKTLTNARKLSSDLTVSSKAFGLPTKMSTQDKKRGNHSVR